MTPTLFPDHDSMSAAAAAWIASRLEAKPDSLLCLATGATPTKTYDLLAARRHGNPEMFSEAGILKLDEWGGIPMESPASCETALRRSLIDPLGMNQRYEGFNSQPSNPVAECQRIQKWLDDSGGIDICVLGLGVNGHLGFNEPDDALQPHCHVATLSEASLQHSMLRQEPTRPTFGMTLGMGDILGSREILLLVSGASKAEAVGKLMKGRMTASFPASFLWLHKNVRFFADRAAMGF